MARTSSDPLKAFVSLRTLLEAERAKLTARLREVDAALGTIVTVAAIEAKPSSAPASQQKRAKNNLSLKEAVVQALGKSALSKSDLLAAVKKLGYQFSAKIPVNSLNTVLYGKKPKFKSHDGKFSVA